jgi:hypothetical protein
MAHDAIPSQLHLGGSSHAVAVGDKFVSTPYTYWYQQCLLCHSAYRSAVSTTYMRIRSHDMVAS